MRILGAATYSLTSHCDSVADLPKAFGQVITQRLVSIYLIEKDGKVATWKDKKVLKSFFDTATLDDSSPAELKQLQSTKEVRSLFMITAEGDPTTIYAYADSATFDTLQDLRR